MSIEHKHHSTIFYEDIIVNEEGNQKEISKLKAYINKINNNINDIIAILKKVKDNIKLYYNENNNNEYNNKVNYKFEKDPNNLIYK